jgi:hypothetical protein
MLSNHKINRLIEADCQETGKKQRALKPLAYTSTTPLVHCLPAGEILRLEGNHRQERIQVLRGTVWLTQPGDAKDHILQGGETFQIQRPGLVLAQGLSSATLRIRR